VVCGVGRGRMAVLVRGEPRAARGMRDRRNWSGDLVHGLRRRTGFTRGYAQLPRFGGRRRGDARAVATGKCR